MSWPSSESPTRRSNTALARQNPFRTELVLRVRYRCGDGRDLETILAHWESHGRRGAIVGPHGSGKTTLLEDLAPRLSSLGFAPLLVRRSREQRSLGREARRELIARCTSRTVVLFDGAEQVGLMPWQALLRGVRHAAGVLATTHRPTRLPTVWRCQTDQQLLREIVASLLPAGETPGADLSALFSKHRGNLRECLRELYDLYAAHA